MIYFISDAHLGSRLVNDPYGHEMRLVRWLDKVKSDAKAIYMLGDMFDFWFEYQTVMPKGFVRFLGKMAELTDSGIEIHYFTGNHDIWTFGYLEKEIGLKIHRKAEITQLSGKKFYLAHGDELFSDEKGFRIIRRIFHSPTLQKLFQLVPPRIGQNFGYAWSKSNREKILHLENNFQGEDNEPLVVFAKKFAETNDVDFLIFGHRHIELDLELKNKSRVIILGDFIGIFSYGIFDGVNFRLETDLSA